MAVDFSHVKSITIPEGDVKKIEAGGVKLWEKEEELTPLCFTAQEANSTVGYTITGSLPDIHIQKSADAINWDDWDGTETLLANVGDKLYVRNTVNTLSTSASSNYLKFTMTGKIAGSGNLDSMINYDALTNYCYANMFRDCTSLTTAPQLPATTLASDCYYYMFYHCTSLTTAPELPATTLAGYCYYYMFYRCTSLRTAPELPATTLAGYCYSSMFRNCSSLRVRTTSGTKIFTCPSSELAVTVTDMFRDTGGEFTGTPVAGETYYYY